MTETEQVLTQALNLPEADRALVVERLIVSLDSEFDRDVELAWQKEIQLRLDEIDRGDVVCVPWEEVRERLRQQRHGAST